MSVHAGPAGSTFYGIEHAGRHTLKINCSNYPQTTRSYILPPLFISEYPEGHHHSTSKPQPRTAPPLSRNEQRTFDGICSGQAGELIEYKVFNLFTKLLENSQDHPILVFRDFELSTKGKFNLKQTTFMSEHPHIPKISMRGEADYIVLLKDLGCVAIEVKRTLSVKSIQKAKDQLDHSESFLTQVMPAVAPNSECLPIAKLIIFEIEDPQGPSVSSSSTSYHYFDCSGDSTVAFEQKWKDIIQELQTNTPTNPLMPFEFNRLARLLTGLWSLKSMNQQPYFDVDESSLPHLMKQVDVSVNHAHLSSAVKKWKNTNDPPVTNVVYNEQETVFRKGKQINLMYLTPDQKNIYDNVQRGIIRGPAGTGKTLLILFKIIDLVQSPNNNKKILLLAPHPHTIRCKNILQANNVVVVNSEEYSHGQPHDVVIMDSKEVFGEHANFSLVDFSSHHIFMDDFQSAFVDADVDIRETLETFNKAYKISSHNLSFYWCMVDEYQVVVEIKYRWFYSEVYFNIGGNTGGATIPVYCLEDILRNTEEITKIVFKKREEDIFLYMNFPNLAARSSHKITSSLPIHHILTNASIDDERIVFMIERIKIDFITERLEEELRQLLRVMNPTMCPSDIAILYDDPLSSDNDDLKRVRELLSSDSKLLKRIRELLSRTFNIIPMTIEQQLKTQSQSIVLDDVKNATSGEWPIVIFLTYHDIVPQHYTAFSRARTRLIVIGSKQRVSNNPNMGVIKWKIENNKFVQY